MLPIRDGRRKGRTGTYYVPGIAPNRTVAVEFTVCRFAKKSVNTSRLLRMIYTSVPTEGEADFHIR
jgi:hypothetical protein